eukprot:SAG25_NODE_2695_length_1442_cov_13.458675_2_plen_167_part_00
MLKTNLAFEDIGPVVTGRDGSSRYTVETLEAMEDYCKKAVDSLKSESGYPQSQSEWSQVKSLQLNGYELQFEDITLELQEEQHRQSRLATKRQVNHAITITRDGLRAWMYEQAPDWHEMVFKSGRAFQRGVRRSMYEPQPRTLAEPKQHQQNGQRLHKLPLCDTTP